MKTITSILSVLVLLLATHQTTKAGEYASCVIRNPSNVAIHYQVKWGDGEWKSNCLYSGRCTAHYYPLDSDGCAPKMWIRFDCIGGDNGTTWESYKIDQYAVCKIWDGKKYAFKYSSCGRYLDLYRD